MFKNLIISLLVLLSHQLLAQPDHIKTAEIETKIWCDHCQECPDCGKNIFLSIKKKNGIKEVVVNDVDQTISVTYNSKKVSLDEIEEAIAMAGFKANDREPDSEAYKKLDGCCKKP